MDQDAIVVRVEGNLAYVEVGGAGAGCGRCHEAGGCQSSILGQLFRTGPRQFGIANAIGAVPGDHVIVRVASGATLRAALLVYAMPVLFLLLGTLAGTAYGGDGNPDSMAALGAIFGVSIGILSGALVRRSSMGKVKDPFLVCRNSSFCIKKEACQ